MARYERILTESWKKFKDNPILIVPHLMMFLVSLALILGFLTLIGVWPLLENIDIYFGHKLSILLFGNLSTNFILFVSYLLLEIIAGSFFLGMKFGMISDVIFENETSMARGISYGASFFKRVIGLHIATFFITYGPLAVIGTIVYFLIKSLGLTVGLSGAILLFIIWFVYMIFVVIRLFFIYPIMTFEKRPTTETLKIDMHYVKTHISHTIISWLIIVGLGILIGILRSPIPIIQQNASNIILIIVLLLVSVFVEMVVLVFEHLFVFESYLAGKK